MQGPFSVPISPVGYRTESPIHFCVVYRNYFVSDVRGVSVDTHFGEVTTNGNPAAWFVGRSNCPSVGRERTRFMKKETLEKIFEYASMPVHGTLSRKIRKDISVQINEDPMFSDATFFLGEEFVRITESKEKAAVNTYYSWDKIISVKTIAALDK